MKPELTIALPVYNDSNYLRHGLDGLLAQTYKDFQLIISDNASTDDTPQILLEYAAKDKRITIYRQNENIGMVRNFNFLKSNAKSEYLMFAACDDQYASNFIETIISGMKKEPGVILGFAPYQFIDSTNVPFGEKRYYDCSGKNAFIRLLKFIFHYDDAKVYGIFRNQAIEGISFPLWWGVNKNSPVNPAFAFLAYVLEKEIFAFTVMMFSG